MINAWGSSDDGLSVGLKRVVRIKVSDLRPVKGTTNLGKKSEKIFCATSLIIKMSALGSLTKNAKIRNGGQSRNVYNNVMVDDVSAPLALYLEYAKRQTAHQRMKIVTEYLNKKRLLEVRARQDNTNFVPPPPQILEQYIKDFQRDGRVTVNPLSKTKIFGVLSELRALLELSYAFYKTSGRK